MKWTMRLIATACLWAAVGAGCATSEPEPVEPDETAASNVARIPTGDLCEAWTQCYRTCQSGLECTPQTPDACTALAICLNLCDAGHQPAPQICPYPG